MIQVKSDNGKGVYYAKKYLNGPVIVSVCSHISVRINGKYLVVVSFGDKKRKNND